MSAAASEAAARLIPFARAALFLDLDGTLAEFEARPDAVGPESRRSDLVRRLSEVLEGRLAIVSGRAIAEVDRIVEEAAACVAGVHGLERRSADGAMTAAAPHPALPLARRAFEEAARAQPGLIVEEKPMSLALHYRAVPESGAEVQRLAADLSAAHGLVHQPGAMVAELRTPGPDKGDAIRGFMAAPPFSGAIPLFVGDDLTDEPGFAAAAELGGHGVLVGPPRPTRANMRLSSPAAVLDWLAESLKAGGFSMEAAR